MKFNKEKLVKLTSVLAPVAVAVAVIVALIVGGGQNDKGTLNNKSDYVISDTNADELLSGELENVLNESLMAGNDSESEETEEETEETTEEPTTEEPKPEMFVANAKTYINVRKGPSTDTELVGKFYAGSGGIILEKGEEWSLVSSGNVVGYVFNELMFFGEEAEAKAWEVGDIYGTVTVNSLRLRKGPSTKKDIVSILNKGAKVTVHSQEDGWAKVTVGKKTGYCSTEYLKLSYVLDEAMTLEEEAAWKAEEAAKKKAEEEAARKKAEAEKKALEQAIANSKFVEVVKTSPYNVTEEDAYLLACLVGSEAGYEPYEGKLAVANIVLNRLNGGRYGDSIKDVIYYKNQFSVVASGAFDRVMKKGPNADSIKAAKEALSGVNNVPRYANFCSLSIAKYDKYAEYTIIGNQVFYRKK